MLLLFACLAPARADDPQPFFLHDGDTVVFYGDSITVQQGYTRDIETYVLTRYPSWHVKFINSGWNGDLVSGGRGGSIETRIKRDILPYHPTVVTILLGMNDGGYTRFNLANYNAFASGLTHLMDTLPKQLPGVRLTLLSPTFYDESAIYSHHIKGYNSVLARYKDFVKRLGGQRDVLALDLNTPMAEATRLGRRHNPRFTIVPDGVHPNDAGHLLMAAIILKAWHAGDDGTTEITLDPTAPTQAATPVPWPLPADAQPAFTVSPLPGELDAVRARVPVLPGDRYDLLIDGQNTGVVTSQQLAEGVNLTRLPIRPQLQAGRVRDLVQQRLDAWRYLWNGGPNALARRTDEPSDAEIAALTALDHWLDTWRDQAHDAAQPQTHVFTLHPRPTPTDAAIVRPARTRQTAQR